jgi:hypothetical protein
MYKRKSDIIRQIQSYHEQAAMLYIEIYDKTGDENIRSMAAELFEMEKSRRDYLEKHKNIAQAMDCFLDFPCDKLSNQVSDCFSNVKTGTDMTVEELIKLKIYFDNCLIKIYNILSAECQLSESVLNIFYYMLKKTKKEETSFATMLSNSRSNLMLKVSAPEA